VDICRHIAAAGAAFGMLLICVAGPTPSLYSSKQQVEVALESECCKLCFECFKCFRGMLQVFHMVVGKVDWDVSYVAIVVHV
jgi:hypothetical protein